MPISSYPRSGQHLAPTTLRCALEVPLSPALASRVGPGLLADLDAGIWERATVEDCKALAAAVVQRIRTGVPITGSVMHHQRLPLVPHPMTFDAIRLSRRTRNCLESQGLHLDLRRLGNLLVADVLAIPAFGAKCLVDLLVSLETVCDQLATGGAPHLSTAISWQSWALDGVSGLPLEVGVQVLPTLPALPIERLGLDTRTGNALRSNLNADEISGLSGRSVRDLLRMSGIGMSSLRTLLRALAVLDPAARDGVPVRVMAPADTLIEEVLGLLVGPRRHSATAWNRDRLLVARYHGLDGEGGATLQELADREGLTRERIRQVCLPARRNVSVIPAAPLLDAALEAVRSRVPARVAQVESELVEGGRVPPRMPLSRLLGLAHLLGRDQLPEIVRIQGNPCIVATENLDIKRAILQSLRTQTAHLGATCVQHVAEWASRSLGKTIAHEVVRRVLYLLDDVCWLDAAEDWVCPRNLARNPLARSIRKVLAVAGRMSLHELSHCVHRARQVRRRPLPRPIFRAFCTRVSGVALEEDEAVADPSLDWRMLCIGQELAVMRIFHEHGPLIHYEDLDRYRQAAGIPRTTFGQYLSTLPTIQRYARGIYGMCGLRIGPDEILACRSRAPTVPAVTRHRVLPNGGIQLAAQLGVYQLNTGGVKIPTPLGGMLHGDFTGSGHGLTLRVRANGIHCWGFSRLYRHVQPEVGQWLLLRFDLVAREVAIEVADQPDAEAGE